MRASLTAPVLLLIGALSAQAQMPPLRSPQSASQCAFLGAQVSGSCVQVPPSGVSQTLGPDSLGNSWLFQKQNCDQLSPVQNCQLTIIAGGRPQFHTQAYKAIFAADRKVYFLRNYPTCGALWQYYDGVADEWATDVGAPMENGFFTNTTTGINTYKSLAAAFRSVSSGQAITVAAPPAGINCWAEAAGIGTPSLTLNINGDFGDPTKETSKGTFFIAGPEDGGNATNFTLNGNGTGSIAGWIKAGDTARGLTVENISIHDGGADATGILTGGFTAPVTLTNVTVYREGIGVSEAAGQLHLVYLSNDPGGGDAMPNGARISGYVGYDVLDGGWGLKTRYLNGSVTASKIFCRDAGVTCEQNGDADAPCGGVWAYSHSLFERGPHSDNYYNNKVGEENDRGGCPITMLLQGLVTGNGNGTSTISRLAIQNGSAVDPRTIGVQAGQFINVDSSSLFTQNAPHCPVTAVTSSSIVIGCNSSGSSTFDKFYIVACANCLSPDQSYVRFTGTVTGGSNQITNVTFPVTTTPTAMHVFPGMGISATGLPSASQVQSVSGSGPYTITFSTCVPNSCGNASSTNVGTTVSISVFNKITYDYDIFIFDGWQGTGSPTADVICYQYQFTKPCSLTTSAPVTVSNSIIVNSGAVYGGVGGGTNSCSAAGPQCAYILGPGVIDGGGNQFYSSRAAAAAGEGWCTVKPVDEYGTPCPNYPYVPPLR